MRVDIFKNPTIYSSLIYYVRGDWNKIDDVNTIIDPGTNDYVLKRVAEMNAGIGKKKVEQVIVTHEHFDHSGGTKYLAEKYNPRILAFSKFCDKAELVKDGQEIKVGDRKAVIIHSPGHSSDSICVYVAEEKTIFSGDTPLRIAYPGGSYIKAYVEALWKLAELDIEKIYSGHDEPILKNGNKIIRETIENVLKSKII